MKRRACRALSGIVANTLPFTLLIRFIADRIGAPIAPTEDFLKRAVLDDVAMLVHFDAVRQPLHRITKDVLRARRSDDDGIAIFASAALMGVASAGEASVPAQLKGKLIRFNGKQIEDAKISDKLEYYVFYHSASW